MTDRMRPSDETDLEERIHRYGRLLSGLVPSPTETPEVATRRRRWEAERAAMQTQLKVLITAREKPHARS